MNGKIIRALILIFLAQQCCATYSMSIVKKAWVVAAALVGVGLLGGKIGYDTRNGEIQNAKNQIENLKKAINQQNEELRYCHQPVYTFSDCTGEYFRGMREAPCSCSDCTMYA